MVVPSQGGEREVTSSGGSHRDHHMALHTMSDLTILQHPCPPLSSNPRRISSPSPLPTLSLLAQLCLPVRSVLLLRQLCPACAPNPCSIRTLPPLPAVSGLDLSCAPLSVAHVDLLGTGKPCIGRRPSHRIPTPTRPDLIFPPRALWHGHDVGPAIPRLKSDLALIHGLLDAIGPPPRRILTHTPTIERRPRQTFDSAAFRHRRPHRRRAPLPCCPGPPRCGQALACLPCSMAWPWRSPRFPWNTAPAATRPTWYRVSRTWVPIRKHQC